MRAEMDDAFEKFVSDRADVAFEFRHSLRDETDRGCALMAAEYLSNQLNELLRAFFVNDARVCNSVLEEPNGALSTLSSRIDFAYLLGLLGPAARRELHLVRKIRNAFAHDYKPLSFTDPAIADTCRELRVHIVIPGDEPRAHFTRTVMGLLAVIHGRLHSVKHTEVSGDVVPKISEKEAQDIKDELRSLFKELISGAQSDTAESSS